MDNPSKTALVLGGTVPHIELIRQLHERGYFVYLLDYTDNPPAKTVADEHIKASTLDQDAVLSIAKQYHTDLVISSCIDQANSTACYVAEHLNLPHPYSFSTSLDVTRKGQMKTLFKKNGIPTSDFYILTQEEKPVIHFPFPFVIKPTDANSSKGVFKIECEKDFYDKIPESFAFSREKKVIVEQFVEGTEIQVDCVASNGKAYVLMTSDKESLQKSGKELQVAGFSIPGPLCERFASDLAIIAQRIANAFSLENTPFFYQAIIGDDGIRVLEFAPRIAGGTRFEMVRMFCGYDYINSSIASFLGEKIDTHFTPSDDKYTIRHIYMRPGIFKSIVGLEEALENGTIDHYFPFVNSGRTITASMSSGNRIGAIMVKASSYEESVKKIRQAMQSIHPINMDDEDCSI